MLLILAFPHVVFCQEKERGQASISVQHRSIRSEADPFEATERETSLIFKLFQDTINYGQWEGNLVLTHFEETFEEGSFQLGLKDFWFTNEIRMDTFLGDHSLYYRIHSDFFLNYQIPVAFLRGLSAELSSQQWNLQWILGRLTKRKGIIGYAFEDTDESLLGLKFRCDFPQDSFFGFGLLRTDEEKDPSGTLIVKNNNLFLLDGRWGLNERLSLLGEGFYSYYDSVQKGTVKDYSLILGPFFKSRKLTFQTNYRNFGRDFRFIGYPYESAANQEGFYADLNIRFNKIYIYGSSDFYWDDPTPDMQRDSLSTWASHFGASFYPRKNQYINVSTSIVTREASRGLNAIDNKRYNLFFGESGYFAKGALNHYARLRYREDRRNEVTKNLEKEPSGIVGLRWQINRRLKLEWEAEVRDLSDTLGVKDERTQALDFFARWRPLSSRLSLSPGVEWIRTKDRVRDDVLNQVAFNLNYGHQFHKRWRLAITTRWLKDTGFHERSYFDLMINLEKIFHWGRPQMRLRIPEPGQRLISGHILGHLFIDENGDRERQPWEDGIPDIPIFLDGRFVSVTDAKGEFEFEHVLIGKHKLSIEMQALPLEYLPAFIQKEVEIQVRKTTEIFFPARKQ